MIEYETQYPSPYTPVYVFGNHDLKRLLSKIGQDRRIAKILALFQFTVRGVPVTYDGEEIGMLDGNISARNAKDPIVDLTIFKNRTFSYATYSLLLTFIAMPFFFLIVPFYLMQGIGLSSSTTGLLFAVISIATIAGSPVSGWLSDRFGPNWFSSLGVGTIAAAFVLMRGFDLQTTVGQMIPILALE